MFKGKQEARIKSITLISNSLKLDESLSVFLKSVQYIRLNDNTLKKIEATDFESLPDLIHLLLTGVGLQSVASGAFDRLTQLNELVADHNHIKYLQSLPKVLGAPIN